MGYGECDEIFNTFKDIFEIIIHLMIYIERQPLNLSRLYCIKGKFYNKKLNKVDTYLLFVYFTY